MTRTKGGGREPRTVEDAMEDAVKRGYVMRVGGGREGSAAANPAADCHYAEDGHPCEQVHPLEEELRERIRALEAELTDVKKWLDATHANQQDIVMERNDAVARAEKAEARVKELEALPPGLHRHPPQTQVCGCDNRTAADLRGEDRG